MVENDAVVIRTIADDLLELIKGRKVVSIPEAAAALKLEPELVEEIVEFFVEARILDWDYKLTTPTVVVHQEAKKKLERLTKKRFVDESQYIAEEFLQEIEQQKSRNLEIESLKGVMRKEKAKPVTEPETYYGKTPEELAKQQQTAPETLKEVMKKLKEAPIEMKSVMREEMASEISKLIDEKVKEQLAKKTLEKALGKETLDKIKEELFKEAAKKAVEESLQKFANPLTDAEKYNIDGLISEINILLGQKKLREAEDKYAGLWLYIISLGAVDVSSYSNEMEEIVDSLERVYNELEKDFNDKVSDINQQIQLGKNFIANSEYDRASHAYNRSLEIEASLPSFFAEDRKRMQHTITRFYTDLIAGSMKQKDAEVDETNKKILAIINEMDSAKNNEKISNYIEDIVKIYNDIPPELLYHKCRISRQLLKIYGKIQSEMQSMHHDKSLLQELINKTKTVLRLIAQKNLKDADEKYNDLWLYLISIAPIDKLYLDSMYSLTDELEKLFEEHENEFIDKSSIIEKYVGLVVMNMTKKQHGMALQYYQKALDTATGMPIFFANEKKRIQRYMLRLYADLAESYINSKGNRITDINKKIINILSTISKTKSAESKRKVIEIIIKLYPFIPAKLFSYKCRISRQLLKVY